VTAVGPGVDDAVRRIATTYEVRGMVATITSYASADAAQGSSSSSSGSDAVNQIVFEYDDFRKLVREYQEHDGLAVLSGSGLGGGLPTTPYVGYEYDDTSSGGRYTKGLRATALRYPNGRLVHYTYGDPGSTADALNRIDSICDDDSGSPGDTLAQYSYLGLRTIVVEDYVEPEVKLDYVGDGSYSGFDRFGRVVDQKWYDYGASEVRDQYRYGYDRAGNRLYRENTTTTGKDQVYTYDGINRLLTFDRGDLNAQKTAISGTPVREEDWTLDPTGNWTDYLQKTSGTTDLDQDRTHTPVNEITTITATTGPDWADPTHDRAGNMTALPKPSNAAESLTCEYDGWNRLVQVKDGQIVVGQYAYDGLKRRMKKASDTDVAGSPSGLDSYTHCFYNLSWQIVESRDAASVAAPPEGLQPTYQYIWSPRHIDSPAWRDENTDHDGLCDDKRLYYLGDAHLNVTTLVDTVGDPAERYVYSPYGSATIYDADWSTTRGTSAYQNSTLYRGLDYAPESGLHQNRQCYYNAALGGICSRDPLGAAAGDPNVYRGTAATSDMASPLRNITITGAPKPSTRSSILPTSGLNKRVGHYTVSNWTTFHPVTMAQMVRVTGSFDVFHDCGSVSVRFEERFVEAWIRGSVPGTEYSFTDSHLASPVPAALCVEKVLGRTFRRGGSTGLLLTKSTASTIAPWSVWRWEFEMIGEFYMRSGWFPYWNHGLPVWYDKVAGASKIAWALEGESEVAGTTEQFTECGFGSMLRPTEAANINDPTFRFGTFAVDSLDKWWAVWNEGEAKPTIVHTGGYVPAVRPTALPFPIM